jgi:hypothetical protein
MIVLESGATNVRESIPQEYLEGVIRAFNSAIVRTFCAAVATSALAALVAIGVEARYIKTSKLTSDAMYSRERSQEPPSLYADN